MTTALRIRTLSSSDWFRSMLGAWLGVALATGAAMAATDSLPPAVESVTSRITLPGLIHDASLISDGGFRFKTR